MFSRRLAVVLCGVCISLAPAMSLAADYAKPGYYVALSTGSAIDMSLEEELKKISSSAKVDASPNIGFRAGARLLPWFAQEIDLEYLIGANISLSGDKSEIDGVVMTTNLRFYWPFGRYQPYGLLGLGFMHAEAKASGGIPAIDGTDVVVRVGAGVEVYWDEHIFADVAVVYVDVGGVLKDLDHLTVRGAVGYKF